MKKELTLKEHEEISKINIQEIYKDVLDKYDIIIHKKVWHLYNETPKIKEFIHLGNDDYQMIESVIDDGIAYLINLVK